MLYRKERTKKKKSKVEVMREKLRRGGRRNVIDYIFVE